MKAYKRLSPIISLLLANISNAAIAGSQSLLDPYANIQPPKSSNNVQKLSPASTDSITPTPTYVTMPMQQDSTNKPKSEKRIASRLGGVKQNCTKTVKTTGSHLANGTRAAGSHLAKSGKFVKNGVANSTKKIRAGIASGAKTSGRCLKKSAHLISHSIRATGTGVKKGTGAVSGKLASLPHAFSHKSAKTNLALQSVGQKSMQTAPTIASNDALVAKGNKPGWTKKHFGKFFKRDSKERNQETASNTTTNIPR